VIALVTIALLILGAAAGALALRNLIHSALLLIGSWAGIAAFYLWAGAEFVAFAQILIYVGAISMIVLFAVLLTRQGDPMPPVTFDSLRRGVSGLIVGGGVAGVLLGAVLGTPLDGPTAAKTPALTVRELGAQLMGPHAAALLIVGLLLTVALLGAVVLASVDRPDGKEDVS
jgi:NADH:ubiquinone oxidoreductase subunit 6 (subunit J)